MEWVDTDGCVNDPADCNLFLSSVTKGVTASVKAAVLLQAEGKFDKAKLREVEKFMKDPGAWSKAHGGAAQAAV